MLLGKLELFVMSGKTLGWFKSYLEEKQQSVYVNGELSESHQNQIALGVPQGRFSAREGSEVTILLATQ